MEQFIINYWLEAFCGMICFFISISGKWIYNRLKKAKDADSKDFEKNLIKKVSQQICEEEEQQRKEVEQSLTEIMEELKGLKKIMSAQDEELKVHLKETNDNLKAVKQATLASYKKEFYSFCEAILAKGFITLEEHRELIKLYETYKDLGGNGNGTILFNKIMQLEVR